MSEEVKQEEVPQIDYIKMIRERFGDYLHSQKVLARAVKSCPVPQINQYLEKRLKEEPVWETKWNLVYAILTNIEVTKCKFCGKQLPFNTIIQNKQYCSEQCQNIDLQIQASKTKLLTQEKTKDSFINKIKNFFNKV